MMETTAGSASVDFARLNEAERRALRLLAEGHTAKSVATLLGCTPGAVNERLREARRKTGAGSSRELARLLRERESRDNEIGMADPAAPGPTPSIGVAGIRPRRLSKGWMMTIMFSALAAIAAVSGGGLLRQSGTTPPVAPDPMVAAAMGEGPSPQERHSRLMAETRDADWADAAERALERHYETLSDIAPPPRITCGRTICEAAGSLRAGLSPAAVQGAVDRVQTDTIAAARAFGLKVEATSFGFRTRPAPRHSFVSYFSRIAD